MELTVTRYILSFRLACLAFLCVFACLGAVSAAWAVEKPAHGELPNFDKRGKAGKPHELSPERGRAADKLRARVPNVRVELDEVTGSPRFVASPHGFLSGPRGQGRGISRE